MLATILKSDRAIEATIAIVETFAKLKQLSSNIAYLNSVEFNVGFMKGKRTVKSDTNPAMQAQIDELKKRIDQMEKK